VGGVFVIDVEGGGDLVRKDAVRELVRDIGWANRSFASSRSFSRRSATSCSREETSTGLAAPNGLERGLTPAELEVIFGEERGLGLAELLVERGINSSFLRVSWGVGGVELFGDVLPRVTGLGLEELRQSVSSVTDGEGRSFGGPISERFLNPLPKRLFVLSPFIDGVNLLPLDHFS